MQFEDPKSMLEAAAAKPARGVDPHTLIKRGRRLRQARYAAVAAGLAVTVAGASASVGLITRRDRARPAGTACDTSERSVSIFVRAGASDGEVARLRSTLEKDPDVERVDYVSPKEVLEMFGELSPDTPIPGPNVIPPQLDVLAVDKAAADRIAAMKGGIIEEVVRGLGEEGLDCLREKFCGRAIPLEAAIFLRDDASDEDVAELLARLNAMPDLDEVLYVSKKDAYREFKRLYSDQPHLYETISPSHLPASVRVTAANEGALESLAETTSPAIDEVRWGGEFIDRLCGNAPATKTPEPSVTETAAPAASNPVAEVTLLRQECGTTLPGLGRARLPDGDPGTWCLFALRIDNQGEVPVVLDPARQRLASKIATRRPWEATGLGNRLFHPIPPGESKLGQLVFLLREEEPVVALEIEITGVLRPLQFPVDGDCAAGNTREQQGSCYSEQEFPPSYVVRGDVLEGTAEVELYHCGLMPIAFDKRSWIADPPPFDATNAPDGFVGRGRMITELGSLSATYVDESGVTVELEAVEGWEQPPCD